MPSNVHTIFWGESTDPTGRLMALVIFRDRTDKRYYHDELGVRS